MGRKQKAPAHQGIRIDGALAKVTRPKLFDAVPRQRLFESFDRALARGPLWLSGPPGAGKTTAMVSFAEVRGLETLWFQFDANDADVATFLHYLRIGLKALIGTESLGLPQLTPEMQPDLSGFVRQYFRALYHLLPRQSLVVFEDFHEVETAEPLHEVLQIALSERPADLGLIVISRAEAPARFARMLANGQLMTIGRDDLKLTEAESIAVAAARKGLGAVAARQAYRQSGGWVAGFLLVLSHLAPEGDAAALSGHSPQVVFNYFAETVFSGLATGAQAVLLKTSFVAAVAPAMAAEICGDPAAERVLRELHERNFFVDRLQQAGAVYRLHDMFRDFLQERVRREWSPEAIAAMQEHCATVLSRHGLGDESIELYERSGHWDRAVAQILQLAPQLLMQGRWQSLLQRIDALPSGTAEQVPWLQFWRSASEAATDIVAARAGFLRAVDAFERQGDALGVMLAAASCINAGYLFGVGGTDIDRPIAKLEEHLARDPEFPDPIVESQIQSGMLLCYFVRDTANPKLQRNNDRLIEICDALLNKVDPNLLVPSVSCLVQALAWLGEFERLRHVIQIANRMTASPALAPVRRIFMHVAAAFNAYLCAAEEDSRRNFAVAIELLGAYNLPHLYASILLSECWYLLDRGDLRQVATNLARAEPLIDRQNFFELSHFHHVRARLCLFEGRLDLALQNGGAAVRIAREGRLLSTEICNVLALAQVHIERCEFPEAKTCSESYWSKFGGIGSAWIEFQVRLVEAYSALRGVDPVLCSEKLRRAFELGRAHRYVSTLQWYPLMMARLVAFALENEIESDYARFLARRRELRAEFPSEAWPWKVRVYTLGDFRVELDGRPLEFSRKVPRKPIALLKAIICAGRQPIPETRLVEQLWPDEEADAGHDALAAALYRLRKLLGDNAAVILRDGRIEMNSALCWVDAFAFEQFLGGASPTRTPANDTDKVERALKLYRGAFLPADSDEPWSLSMRERLRAKFIRQMDALGRAAEARNEHDSAAKRYARALEEDDLVEEFYQGLMRCHLSLGNRSEGIATYHRMKRILAAALGVAPSPGSERLLQDLKGSST